MTAAPGQTHTGPLGTAGTRFTAPSGCGRERHASREQVPEDPNETQADIRLVSSAEPAVVFASLAARCVPQVCDSVVVDIADCGAYYRIAYPPDGETPSRGLAAVTAPERRAEHQVRLRFGELASHDGVGHDGVGSAGDDGGSGVSGVATFEWQRRTPPTGFSVLAAALIQQALHLIDAQRSELRARAAAAQVEHLRTALQTSRQIGAAMGILMSLHKITDTEAFDQLRLSSQHTHRKLRDVALDVLDTGWLDPALVPAPAPRTGRDDAAPPSSRRLAAHSTEPPD